MRRVLTPLHVVAASVGILCTAVEVLSNVEHSVQQTKTLYDPAVASVVATSIGVTIALACAMEAFRQRHLINGFMLLAAFALGAAYTITTTLDRVATNRDAALAKKWDGDAQIKDLVALQQRVSYMAARECAGGRGQKCDAISAEVKIADKRLADRRGELDSMGKRLAAIVPGIDASTASLYQPMLLPVSLFIMGAWLVAFGINGKKVQPEFRCELAGRDALEARAEKFADAFQAQHGRVPKPLELQRELGIKVAAARRLHKSLQMA